jgi:hypothetical protein
LFVEALNLLEQHFEMEQVQFLGLMLLQEMY